MTSLKSLLDQRMSLDEQIEAAYGEISPEMESAITEVELNLPTKVDGYVGLLDRLKQDQELFESKAEKYSKRSTAIKNLREKLLENVKQQMVARGIEKLEGNSEVFKVTKGKPSVHITESSNIPDKYFETTITKRPKKDDLRIALEKGEVFPGVELRPTMILKRGVK